MKNRSIESQIRYLDQEMELGLDYELQNRFPEGFIFSNVLLALSVIEHSNNKADYDPDQARIVDNCLSSVFSNSGTKYFSPSLKLSYGSFYNGWCNYALKKYLSSPMIQFSDSIHIWNEKHAELTNNIINSQADSVTILESYHDGIWPADNLVCLASLPDSFVDVKRKWLEVIYNYSDNVHQLICHEVHSTEVVRGSSQALSLYFLSELDSSFFDIMMSKFETEFHKDILGLKLVREYPVSESGSSDVDSGPLVFGIGSVATIMNVKTQHRLRDPVDLTWGFLNVLGIPVNIFGKKYYLAKQEPMFDLFMLWVNI